MIKKIAKDWRVKMAAQKGFGLLPSNLAFRLNDRMVRLATGSLGSRIDTLWRANKCLENLALVRESGALQPDTLDSVLEMGTGWHGIDLIVFYLLGAQEIVTVDHWRHLKGVEIARHIDRIEQGISDLELKGWIETAEAKGRLSSLRGRGRETGSLGEILEKMNCRYLIAPSCRLDRIGLQAESVSFFYTESVLQRVPTQDLEISLNHLGGHLLKPGGAFFIRTDQKDIHAQEHVGTSLWPFNYLKYSDRLYDWMSSEKLNYQNRLRESDFMAMLQNVGLEIARVESSVHEEDLERIGSIKVNSRFEGYDAQDLVTRASRIVGNKITNSRLEGRS